MDIWSISKYTNIRNSGKKMSTDCLIITWSAFDDYFLNYLKLSECWCLLSAIPFVFSDFICLLNFIYFRKALRVYLVDILLKSFLISRYDSLISHYVDCHSLYLIMHFLVYSSCSPVSFSDIPVISFKFSSILGYYLIVQLPIWCIIHKQKDDHPRLWLFYNSSHAGETFTNFC